jgi:CRP-like cAMP-binding protein
MKGEGKPSFDLKIFLARVEAGKTRVELRRRQIVFSQGDAADSVFYIQKGKIELKVLSQQGKEAILAILSACDFFGEGCLAGQPLRMATAAAVTECSVVRLDKSAMIKVLRDEPVFSALFMSYLRRSCRPAIQFERKTLGAPPFAVGELRQRRQTRGSNSESQPGNLGRDDRHYPIAGKLFHEQIPQTRLHRIQRRPERS